MENIPKHVVIIPDGNRRWAKDKFLKPWNGHSVGAENILSLSDFAYKAGVKYLTSWGFSTENWEREKTEVDMIMDLFINFIKENKKLFIENKISFTHFGRRDRLPVELINQIDILKKETENFNEYHFALALDYGGRDEIERAIIKKEETGIAFSKCLDTVEFPDVDLIIRTGGEKRTSGILPWQSVYAEYYFSDLYFPDFKSEQFKIALEDYSNRKRRFGK